MRKKEVQETTHELADDSETVERLDSKPAVKNPMAQRIIKAIEKSGDVTIEDVEVLLQVIKENQRHLQFDLPFEVNEQENQF